MEKEVIVDGYKGKKSYEKSACATYTSGVACSESDLKSYNANIPYLWWIYFEDINHPYDLSASWNWNDKDYQQAEIITTQILSTFKFLD